MAESTQASMFADSAIDMPASPPSVKHPDNVSNDDTEPFVLSDRLEHLTATVRKAEQERRIGSAQAESLHNILVAFDSQLSQQAKIVNLPPIELLSESGELCPVDTSHNGQLEQVHLHLCETIAAIRLRQQERRHLHSLLLTKLDDVEQRCHTQEQQLQEQEQELQVRRHENLALSNRVRMLADRELHREVALDAMTSAATGLEVFLDDTKRRSSPGLKSTPRHQVIRGRGRFRGKYYVEDLADRNVGHPSSPTAVVEELHDGVRAWLRGFRDVEEEVRSPGKLSIVSRQLESDAAASDDDWGTFEQHVGRQA